MRRAAVLILVCGFICGLGGLSSPALATEPAPAAVADQADQADKADLADKVDLADEAMPEPRTKVPNRIGRGAIQQGPVATTQRRGKSSGFWTSDVPTPDRPYRWSYMAMGIVIMSMMGILVFVLIRRATRERDASETS